VWNNLLEDKVNSSSFTKFKIFLLQTFQIKYRRAFLANVLFSCFYSMILREFLTCKFLSYALLLYLLLVYNSNGFPARRDVAARHGSFQPSSCRDWITAMPSLQAFRLQRSRECCMLHLVWSLYHVSAALKELHRLPVAQRIVYSS